MAARPLIQLEDVVKQYETPAGTLTATAQWRGRSVGVVFRFFQLLPTLSLLDNVVLPMEFCRMWTRRERRERAH